MRVLALAALAACGGGSTPAMPDAAKHPDAAVPTTVVAVDCASTTAAATVTTVDTTFAYMPVDSTISMGQVVKFVMSTNHNVEPNPLQHTDPGLVVDLGQTKCLRFTQTGTWNFMCTIHSFVGSVTVN